MRIGQIGMFIGQLQIFIENMYDFCACTSVVDMNGNLIVILLLRATYPHQDPYTRTFSSHS
jgi:hypothetical protein